MTERNEPKSHEVESLGGGKGKAVITADIIGFEINGGIVAQDIKGGGKIGKEGPLLRPYQAEKKSNSKNGNPEIRAIVNGLISLRCKERGEQLFAVPLDAVMEILCQLMLYYAAQEVDKGEEISRVILEAFNLKKSK